MDEKEMIRKANSDGETDHAAETSASKPLSLLAQDNKLIPPPSNSNLMNRLRDFLPQMQSANQALFSVQNDTDYRGQQVQTHKQLDIDLKLDDSDEESGSSGSESPKNNALIQELDQVVGNVEAEKTNEIVTETSTSATDNPERPTIMLEFALGDMTENPVMKFLANDEDDSDDDTSSSTESCKNISGINPNESARIQSISNLLRTSTTPLSSLKSNEIDGSPREDETTKKPLITEIS